LPLDPRSREDDIVDKAALEFPRVDSGGAKLLGFARNDGIDLIQVIHLFRGAA
jgi:hypothetical protein